MFFYSLCVYCFNYLQNLFTNNNKETQVIDDIGISWNNIHHEKIIITIHNPMNNIYQPPPNAEPNAPPPTALAAIGSKDSIPIPGVAAPTKGVVSC